MLPALFLQPPMESAQREAPPAAATLAAPSSSPFAIAVAYGPTLPARREENPAQRQTTALPPQPAAQPVPTPTPTPVPRAALPTAITPPRQDAIADASLEEDFGGETQMASDADLSAMRGAFITSSGMILDLGLMTQTRVNGAIIEETHITPEQIAALKVSDLQTLVQVGKNVESAQKVGLSDLPQIVTAIQNQRNDVTIDNLTILNLDVQNIARFNLQTQTGLVNHQIVAGIR